MKPGFRLICCLSILVLFSGCWDHKELNQVSIITGMAVDRGDKKKYKLSVESLNPSELNPNQAAGNAPSIIYSLEGDSLADMSRRMNIGLSKKMIYSHMRTVVISEEVAREGLLDYFDYLERYREIRDDFNVVIAKDVQASDILKISYPVQKVSTLKLHMQLNTAADDWGADPNIRKKDIISSWTSEGRQPVTAVVTITGPPKKGNSVDNMKNLEPQAMVELVGMSIFNDQKLIGFLPLRDTRNYLWTQNKLNLTSLAIPCDKNKLLTVRVFRSHTKVQTTYRDDKPHIGVNIDIESRLDATQCGEDLSKLKTYQGLERKIENYVKEEVRRTIRNVQRTYKVDIFGFGEEMKRQEYGYFKSVKDKWDEEFSKANIEVNASVTLRRSGIRTKSFLTEIK